MGEPIMHLQIRATPAKSPPSLLAFLQVLAEETSTSWLRAAATWSRVVSSPSPSPTTRWTTP